jgi:hypothetical protein
MFLMLLVAMSVVLVVLIVLKRLPQIHLHPKALMAPPPIHHHIVALVPMALVEHAELLRRLPPRRSRR